jgi:hypothetical protein
MAEDAVTIIPVTPSAGVDRGAGTTINTTNGAVIDVGGDTSDLLVIITNTNTTPDHDVTFAAGDNPPAVRSSLGARVEQVNAAETWFVIEGARHVQDDGKIHITFESGFAGKVHAVRLTGV